MFDFYSPKNFTKQLEGLLTKSRLAVAGALVTYALARNEDLPVAPLVLDWKTGTTLVKCRCVISDETRTPRSDADYGKLLLGERWISGIDDILSFLQHLINGSTSRGTIWDQMRMDPKILKIEKLVIEPLWDELFMLNEPGYDDIDMERIDGHGDEWPAWVFTVKRTERTPFLVGSSPLGPLIKSPLRPYESSFEAINDWFKNAEKPMIRESPLTIFRDFTIIVPDTRARIVQANWQNDTLQVEIGSRNQNANVKVQGIAHAQSEKIDLPTEDLAPAISWNVPDRTSSIELFVVADGELLSKTEVYHRVTPSESVVKKETLSPYKPEEQPWFTRLPKIRDKQAAVITRDIDTLIVVAVPVELEAVLRRLRPLENEDAILKVHIETRTYYLGKLGAFKTVVTMSNVGAIGRDGSILATKESIDKWRPKAILMPGIAFGANPNKQRIADVLVGSKVIVYEPQRVGKEETIQRGPVVEPGQTLLDRFRNVIGWEFHLPDESKSKVHLGFFLSGEKLIDNPELKASLIGKYPEAIGGDMEAAGIYAAAGKIDWIVAKAICDWADGKKGESQQALAAAASVSLVEYVLNSPDALSGLSRG